MKNARVVSVYKSYTEKIKDTDVTEILKGIKLEGLKEQIDEMRAYLGKGNTEMYDRLKNKLPAFTTSGTFKNRRVKKDINQYSKMLILDIDKVTKEQLEILIYKTRLASYTYASFISPSGLGLKIIVKISSELEYHSIAYQQVVDYYEKALEVQLDLKNKDYTRLCFISSDPDIYINENSEIFQVDVEEEIETQPKIKPTRTSLTSFEILDKCKEFTDKVQTYQNGNRNNFIHSFACNANRWGVNETDTLEYSLQNFDLPQKENRRCVKSAYKHNAFEFASFANIATLANSKQEENKTISKEERLFSMPYLPDEIFPKLPHILKEGCKAFSDRRERDVFFTGSLTVLSGCIEVISGGYRGKTHFANLFSFIIAPAASGKGALTYAKDLGEKYHDKLVKESQAAYKQYQIELAEYKKMASNKKNDVSQIPPPEEPPFKVLYIPANNSSARVIQQLKEGEEKGIFCETEADSMGNVLKQDWGGYSDLLRKAFHHEPISYSRKTNKEWVELKRPKLSVALAGTPGQVQNLIASAEDGLFSRFLFYTFKSEVVWIDAAETNNGVNLTEHFDKLSNQVLEFIEYYKHHADITFKLTDKQWALLNDYGRECLYTVATFVSEDLSSTAKRLGLIVYRIAMILTVLRYYENGEIETTYTCSDEDFEIALALIKVYQEHSIFMFKELPKNGSVTDEVMQRFYEALPAKFQRKNAIKIAETLSIKERTADLYLSKLKTFKYLDKIKNGMYKKLK
ncbi:MAG: DUF3987 domain-containing protein [Mesonia sp.]|uniref:DUF3987 domain-containing protein n=1 Tax=Mesonia sp. TaxID=1960830 RepID=UPI003F97F148